MPEKKKVGGRPKKTWDAREIAACNVRVEACIKALVPDNEPVRASSFYILFWGFKSRGKEVSRVTIRRTVNKMMMGKAHPRHIWWIRHLEKATKMLKELRKDQWK